jgi:hypothetical protein
MPDTYQYLDTKYQIYYMPSWPLFVALSLVQDLPPPKFVPIPSACNCRSLESYMQYT